MGNTGDGKGRNTAVASKSYNRSLARCTRYRMGRGTPGGKWPAASDTRTNGTARRMSVSTTGDTTAGFLAVPRDCLRVAVAEETA